jgi:hypothetical protein
MPTQAFQSQNGVKLSTYALSFGEESISGEEPMINQLAQCRAAVIDEITVGIEDAVQQPVVAHDLLGSKTFSKIVSRRLPMLADTRRKPKVCGIASSIIYGCISCIASNPIAGMWLQK